MALNWNAPFNAAFNCTVVVKPGYVVIGNVALVSPAGMKTLLGALADSGWLLPMFTKTPGGGAALASVTVPVAGSPPTTDAGFTVSGPSAGSVG
jgi:hypothetical protein